MLCVDHFPGIVCSTCSSSVVLGSFGKVPIAKSADVHSQTGLSLLARVV